MPNGMCHSLPFNIPVVSGYELPFKGYIWGLKLGLYDTSEERF